uniref:Nitrogen regulatory protein P-II family n=1 Tax=Candidatus Kentrum sp. LPFa TaxID=2126335 RepID=A0A450X4J2_9GAMM|nr:MAG: nitrogen regulatory protein P-II family [Candidatus Kentron sp. LPFa]VFK18497.1 MAG: nitrogen regulatory protein P-II family [Candidatus Kentron sp. LPFa]VFK24195.1 MAG: nitrogen regulatory protein P-II family [Candidatus Kentron sp. LPFa]
MHFKLLVVLVEDHKTRAIMEAAKQAGATGATVLNQARGEGIQSSKTFLGLNLEIQRNVLLFLVEEHLSRAILETIEEVGEFTEKGTGIAFQIDVEDAVGVLHQVEKLAPVVEKKL